MTSKEARQNFNDFCRARGGCWNLTEFDAGVVYDLNVDYINALDDEHPGAVRFVKYYPEAGGKAITPYHRGDRIYTFSSDLVVLADSPHYGAFVSALEHWHRCRKNHAPSECEAFSAMCAAALATGGDVMLWE